MTSGTGRHPTLREAAPLECRMEPESTRRGWSAAAAIVVLAAAPNLWVTLSLPSAFESWRLVAWWGVYIAYVAAFAACSWWAIPTRGTQTVGLLLAAQTIAALGANWLIPTVIGGVATGGALLVVVASQLSRLPAAVATPWVIVQHALLLGIYLNAWPTPIALVAGAAFAVFSFVVLAMERLALRESRLRVQLASTLTELTAARQSLESRARDGERLRIARDLHDVLGHHLVALSLQLQLAERSEPDQARGGITRASALTRLLLGDLRAVVADLREQPATALVEALNAMQEHEGTPRVIVRTHASVPALSDALGQTVLRAAQELVTNARKHARASQIVVELTDGELRVEDDGLGGPITPATGLRGLRERLDAIGGELTVEHPARGTRIRVRFPLTHSSEVHA
jgi:signal transduction histidine kinase